MAWQSVHLPECVGCNMCNDGIFLYINDREGGVPVYG